MNTNPVIFVIDDDAAVRQGIQFILEEEGFTCQTFASAEHFLSTLEPGTLGCLLLDVNLPGLKGDELQVELKRRHIHLPIIFLTAYGDIPMSVRAIKNGAIDFLTKPVNSEILLLRLNEALSDTLSQHNRSQTSTNIREKLGKLSYREMEVLSYVLSGIPNKEIGQHLAISHRTVELHRVKILKKTGNKNFLELAKICELADIQLTNHRK